MNKEILRLAIPNIISNVSVPLLSTVDTALMGHLSQVHLGAVGLGAMLFNLVYWNFGFLRMGTTGMTAQAYGARDQVQISNLLLRSLMISTAISVVIILVHNPLEGLGLWFFQVEGFQGELLSEYFGIRIWAAPATLASYVVFGWLFGMQNAVYPLILTIFVNAINIVLSYILTRHLNLGIAGVAWGTVLAQYAGLFLSVLLLWSRYKEEIQIEYLKVVQEAGLVRKFFIINRDLFIRTLCLTLAFAFFYRQSSVMGATILAVNVVLLQLINWMSYGIDGIAYAAESLIGKYKGGHNIKEGNKAIRYVMMWGLGLAILYSLTYAIWSEAIFGIYTDQQEVIDASKPFLWYMVAFPLAGFICYIWDGIFIGLTASVTMRNAMLLSFCIYFITYYLLRELVGPHSIWIALLFFLLIRGVIQSLYFRKLGWNIR